MHFSRKPYRYAKGPILEGAVAAGDWGSSGKNPFRHRLRRCHLPQGDGFSTTGSFLVALDALALRATAYALSVKAYGFARFPLLSPTVTSSPGAGEVFPQRESQGLRLVAKVLGIKRKFPAVLLPLPLGEVDANVVSRRRGRTPLAQYQAFFRSPTKSLAYRRRVRYYILYTL